ncbi:RNA-binding domain-containing protein [Rhizopogon salebrosus TDB-379]|nr:RNA-binding domain-containing protein [Rhizopogon salebrosus TDB-379]
MDQYGEPAAPSVDPYSDAYNAPAPAAASETRDRDAPAARGRSRSRSPGARSNGGYRSPAPRRRSPPPKRPTHAPIKAPNPSQVLGVFGLSIRTQERDLDEEFSRFGRVEKVTIVYDQRSDRSRGFGFIRMSNTDEAARCIAELNGVELNGRRIRVDYSVTDRPHAPTPGEYMGHRRSTRDSYSGSGRDSYHRDSYRDSYRDRDHRRSDRDKDRDPYGRDSRDWRDRRSPPRSGRYSPDYRRRGSYSRSPPRGSSPRKDYEAPAGNGAASTSNQAENGSRW